MGPFASAGQWIMGQAGWAVASGTIIIMIVCLIQRRVTAMISTLILGGVISVFAFGGVGVWQQVGTMFTKLLGL